MHFEHFYQDIDGYMTKSNTDLFNKMCIELPESAVWVELGSWLGKSLAYCVVQSKQQGKKFHFHAIDTWRGSEEHVNQKDIDMIRSDGVFDKFLNNIKPISNYVKIQRGTSWEQASQFSDLSVDFCYVDASHRYEDVKNDIQSWWPKIRPGGFFGGDDYRQSWPGVKRAVKEFVSQKKLPMQKIGRCWLVQKC